MTPADDRCTVDQHIRDSDLAARRILQSPEEVAAPAMLRSWAEVIECAAELWHALPGTPGPVEPKSVGLGDHGDAAMSRLDVMAAARTEPWPPRPAQRT